MHANSFLRFFIHLRLLLEPTLPKPLISISPDLHDKISILETFFNIESMTFNR